MIISFLLERMERFELSPLMEPEEGLEPPTRALQVRRSTTELLGLLLSALTFSWRIGAIYPMQELAPAAILGESGHLVLLLCHYFFFPLPALLSAMAIACFCGAPDFISVLMLVETAFLDFPFTRGIWNLHNY
jgi:hypothetical protein